MTGPRRDVASGRCPTTDDRAELIELLGHHADIEDFDVPAHHAVTGHVVRIDDGTERIHAHVRVEHWLPGEPTWLVVGLYDDESVRTPQGRRLTRVGLTAVHQENQSHDLVPSAG
ncbi:nuclear transport factor 2 family protein [Lentzea jiangxiensis]|uniref:SnoaL-like domain-containing protein n=1 Tax=Lentzea jiangxiensis TaxID=641025 RepID=A0A1H0LM56_9PSEU|nr:nuclear transport factor 2 family protein [Lentzea jiangxiensis]SDO69143.1 SnoaL-like domain-containing protein [Lentzea jiangxiensis]